MYFYTIAPGLLNDLNEFKEVIGVAFQHWRTHKTFLLSSDSGGIDEKFRDGFLQATRCQDYRLLQIPLPKNSSALEAVMSLSGCGQVILCAKKVFERGEEVGKQAVCEILLLFPNGVSRFKSADELKRIRHEEKELRVELAFQERRVEKHDGQRGMEVVSKRGRSKPRRISPASELKDFLLQTFGRERLMKGSGIVDVAGGKGELSFKLVAYAELPSTIVDPRPYNLRGMLKYVTKDHILRKTSSEAPVLKLKLPTHLQCWFTHESSSSTEREGKALLDFDTTLQQESGNLYVHDKLTSSSDDKKRLQILLKDCSLVVGLHPDQATEFIVDYCLATETPFVIVPCCVFPNSALFKHRKHVKAFDDFVRYLKAKDERIKEATLTFPGRNVVLFFSPELFTR